MPLIRRDGSYFGTLCTLDPSPRNLTDDNLEVFHLLSQLIAFELEADERHHQQEAELRALEDFTAIAAHDLRQPLATLQLRAQRLVRRARANSSSEELAGMGEALITDIRRTIDLSNMLLDVAHIDSGSLTIEKTRFDLADLVQRIVNDAKSAQPVRPIVVTSPADLSIHGDEHRLGQVLRNLIDNAAKYSPDPSTPIEIALTSDVTADEGMGVLVTVRDYGVGVNDKELPRLFNRRYRASTAREHSISGSGMGLYIARQIVEAHGGSIWAEHAPDRGLVINLSLPVGET